MSKNKKNYRSFRENDYDMLKEKRERKKLSLERKKQRKVKKEGVQSLREKEIGDE